MFARPYNRRRIIVSALIFMSAFAAVSFVMPGQFGLRYFVLGVKHGAEDRQTGIRYATDSPGWKMVRNSSKWTSGDKELVQQYMASSINTSGQYTSAFMTGYKIGFVSPMAWLAGGVAIMLVIAGSRRFTRMARS